MRTSLDELTAIEKLKDRMSRETAHLGLTRSGRTEQLARNVFRGHGAPHSRQSGLALLGGDPTLTTRLRFIIKTLSNCCFYRCSLHW